MTATNERKTMRLPAVGLDYVTHLAVSPVDGNLVAVATDRRHVYQSADGGATWRQLARDGDLP